MYTTTPIPESVNSNNLTSNKKLHTRSNLRVDAVVKKDSKDTSVDRTNLRSPLIIDSYPGYKPDIYEFCLKEGLHDDRERVYEICMLFLSLIEKVSVFQETPKTNPFYTRLYSPLLRIAFPEVKGNRGHILAIDALKYAKAIETIAEFIPLKEEFIDGRPRTIKFGKGLSRGYKKVKDGKRLKAIVISDRVVASKFLSYTKKDITDNDFLKGISHIVNVANSINQLVLAELDATTISRLEDAYMSRKGSKHKVKSVFKFTAALKKLQSKKEFTHKNISQSPVASGGRVTNMIATIPPELRGQLVTKDGESLVEVDASLSHLNILHAITEDCFKRFLDGNRNNYKTPVTRAIEQLLYKNSRINPRGNSNDIINARFFPVPFVYSLDKKFSSVLGNFRLNSKKKEKKLLVRALLGKQRQIDRYVRFGQLIRTGDWESIYNQAIKYRKEFNEYSLGEFKRLFYAGINNLVEPKFDPVVKRYVKYTEYSKLERFGDLIKYLSPIHFYCIKTYNSASSCNVWRPSKRIESAFEKKEELRRKVWVGKGRSLEDYVPSKINTNSLNLNRSMQLIESRLINDYLMQDYIFKDVMEEMMIPLHDGIMVKESLKDIAIEVFEHVAKYDLGVEMKFRVK